MNSIYIDFIEAANTGNINAILQYIIKNSNNPDAVNIVAQSGYIAGYTALICAAINGHTDIVRVLLAAGANVHAISQSGSTALSLAAGNGHTAVVQALLATSADVNATNQFGNTALILAAGNGHTAVVQDLLTGSADVNAANQFGHTALILAAMNGRTDTVRALLAAPSIDLNVKNKQNRTAADEATKYNHPKIARLIIAAIKAINKQKLESCTSDNRYYLFHVARDIQVIAGSYLAGEDTAPRPSV